MLLIPRGLPGSSKRTSTLISLHSVLPYVHSAIHSTTKKRPFASKKKERAKITPVDAYAASYRMHWRHIKWRAPGQKRHLSVLEKFQAEDTAKRKAAEMQKIQDEAAHVRSGSVTPVSEPARLTLDSVPLSSVLKTERVPGVDVNARYVAFEIDRGGAHIVRILSTRR